MLKIAPMSPDSLMPAPTANPATAMRAQPVAPCPRTISPMATNVPANASARDPRPQQTLENALTFSAAARAPRTPASRTARPIQVPNSELAAAALDGTAARLAFGFTFFGFKVRAQ